MSRFRFNTMAYRKYDNNNNTRKYTAPGSNYVSKHEEEKRNQHQQGDNIRKAILETPVNIFKAYFAKVTTSKEIYIHVQQSMLIFVNHDTNIESNLIKFIICITESGIRAKTNPDLCGYTPYNDLAWSEAFKSDQQKFRFMIANFVLQNSGFSIFDKNSKEIDGKNGENSLEALLARMKKTGTKHEISQQELEFRYDCLVSLNGAQIKGRVKSALNKISGDISSQLLEELRMVYIVDPECVIEEFANKLLMTKIKGRHEGDADKFMQNFVQILQYIDNPSKNSHTCYDRFFNMCNNPGYFDKCTYHKHIVNMINSISGNNYGDITIIWKSIIGNNDKYNVDKIEPSKRNQQLLTIMMEKICANNDDENITQITESCLKNYAITLGNMAAIDKKLVDFYNEFVASCFDNTNTVIGINMKVEYDLKITLGIYAIENSCLMTQIICDIISKYYITQSKINKISSTVIQIIRFLPKFLKPEYLNMYKEPVRREDFAVECIKKGTLKDVLVFDITTSKQTVVIKTTTILPVLKPIAKPQVIQKILNPLPQKLNMFAALEDNEDESESESTKDNIYDSDIDTLKKQISELKNNYKKIIAFLQEKYCVSENNDEVQESAKKIKTIIRELKLNIESLEDAIYETSSDPITDLLVKAINYRN